jgi:putative transposase
MRVARLMRKVGLFGCGGRRRRKARTTLRSPNELTPPAPDPVKRDFTPEAPDRLLAADITFVRTWEGWLYLSFVLDSYSRKGRRMVHGQQPRDRSRAGCVER